MPLPPVGPAKPQAYGFLFIGATPNPGHPHTPQKARKNTRQGSAENEIPTKKNRKGAKEKIALQGFATPGQKNLHPTGSIFSPALAWLFFSLR